MKDEQYIINLCDKVLDYKGKRQHRFDFLRGDPSAKRKNGTKLPVDSFYECHKLVIEYYERQHSESVPFFDNKATCSRVTRGEQRKIYDQRRRDKLPENGITLIEISFNDFGKTKRLKRNEKEDEKIIREKLNEFLNKKTIENK